MDYSDQSFVRKRHCFDGVIIFYLQMEFYLPQGYFEPFLNHVAQNRAGTLHAVFRPVSIHCHVIYSFEQISGHLDGDSDDSLFKCALFLPLIYKAAVYWGFKVLHYSFTSSVSFWWQPTPNLHLDVEYLTSKW